MDIPMFVWYCAATSAGFGSKECLPSHLFQASPVSSLLLHLLFENGGSPPKISRFKVEGSLGGELRPIEALNFPR
jgi:hypothetical protein